MRQAKPKQTDFVAMSEREQPHLVLEVSTKDRPDRAAKEAPDGKTYVTLVTGQIVTLTLSKDGRLHFRIEVRPNGELVISDDADNFNNFTMHKPTHLWLTPQYPWEPKTEAATKTKKVKKRK